MLPFSLQGVGSAEGMEWGCGWGSSVGWGMEGDVGGFKRKYGGCEVCGVVG